MNDFVSDFLQWIKRRSSLAAAVSLRHFGELRKAGWFRSVWEGASVDAEGKPIPWIAYPALRFIEKRIPADATIFECGSGNSTLWWAARVKQVIACEAHADWHAHVSGLAPENARVLRVDEAEYPDVLVKQSPSPDVIVIDGGDRCACADAAISAVNDAGVIIWDDSNRPEYAEGIARLREAGFRELDFSGLGPIVNLTKVTSVFYRPGNLLGI